MVVMVASRWPLCTGFRNAVRQPPFVFKYSGLQAGSPGSCTAIPGCRPAAAVFAWHSGMQTGKPAFHAQHSRMQAGSRVCCRALPSAVRRRQFNDAVDVEVQRGSLSFYFQSVAGEGVTVAIPPNDVMARSHTREVAPRQQAMERCRRYKGVNELEWAANPKSAASLPLRVLTAFARFKSSQALVE